MEKAALGGPGMRVQTVRYMNGLARRYIELDDLRAAELVAERMQGQVELLRQESAPDSNVVRWAEAMRATLLARMALARHDAATALAITSDWLPRIEPIEPQSGEDRIWRTAILFFLHDLQAHAQYALGRPADSERSARAALAELERHAALDAEGRAILRDVPPDYRRLAYLRTWLDLANG